MAATGKLLTGKSLWAAYNVLSRRKPLVWDRWHMDTSLYYSASISSGPWVECIYEMCLQLLNRELLTRWTLTRFDPRSMTHWPVKWSAAEISVSVSAGTYRMNRPTSRTKTRLYYRLVCMWSAYCTFCPFTSACQRESVIALLFFCSCLPLSYIIHHRTDCRLLYWKKCLFSDNVLLQTIQAMWCYDNIFSLCMWCLQVYH